MKLHYFTVWPNGCMFCRVKEERLWSWWVCFDV
jgi:hypothetical protein